MLNANMPKRLSARVRQPHGFTIVELLFAMVIVAILALIAMPSFADALRRARRAEAVGALMQLQLAQQRWRTDHARYASDLHDLGIAPATTTGLYTLALVEADEYSFVATATAAGQQSADAPCQVLRLSQDGGQTTRASLDASGIETSMARNRCWQ